MAGDAIPSPRLPTGCWRTWASLPTGSTREAAEVGPSPRGDQAAPLADPGAG